LIDGKLNDCVARFLSGAAFETRKLNVIS